MSYPHEIASFEALKEWLNSLPNQHTGVPFAVCQTGEKYIEVFEEALSRPGDEAVIERRVATNMHHRLHKYFEGKSGAIYWRIPFEYDIVSRSQVIRPDESSEDIDYATGRRCLLDKNWKSVRAYCRVYRATYPTDAEFGERIQPAGNRLDGKPQSTEFGNAPLPA